ncbi:MAG: hypothetical protein QOC63_3938 [Mycobacterium sp.]|jgi:hypothetical protein|nr:hypothetical protein [Mycobacterium sp.]
MPEMTSELRAPEGVAPEGVAPEGIRTPSLLIRRHGRMA